MNAQSANKAQKIIAEVGILKQLHDLTAYVRPEEEAIAWRFQLNDKIQILARELKNIVEPKNPYKKGRKQKTN